MRREKELVEGCMAKARNGEMTFVLLGRDIATPAAIREWCRLRCLHGKNSPKDLQITEALECADTMERERIMSVLNPVL